LSRSCRSNTPRSMGLFDIFRRKKDNAPEGPEKPRIDYLL
jgi:hypothetical protein